MNDADSTHESFIRLLLRHEPSVRAVIRSVVHRAEDVDEVMQAVSLVAWRKFDSLTDREGFGRWACVIARYEILKFLRTRARERFVLDTDLVERILAEAGEEAPGRAKRLSLLERCLEKLPETRRQLLLEVYTPGCTARALAGRLGRSEDALYQMLRRLRLDLRKCVESGLAGDGGAS
ncbi:MAG: sigma-70 family RNA polymerase sigma factor [Verrucomicrobia bacterium]|nr:sigma-70 family RNA polymerase sigma factor [Verrucomicrobiota bacterium]